MTRDQLERLKELDVESQRFKRVAVDLSLGRMGSVKDTIAWMVSSPERAGPLRPFPPPSVH